MSVAKSTRGDPCNQEGGTRVSESAGWLVASLKDLKELAEDAHSDSASERKFLYVGLPVAA